MKEQEFWDLINDAHTQAAGIAEELSILSTTLNGLSSDEIVDFQCRYYDCYERAYRWDLWGAAYLINGGCSSDGFEYFIGWLIAQGQETFESVLKDPECLVTFEIEGDAECEEMLGLIGRIQKGHRSSRLRCSCCGSYA